MFFLDTYLIGVFVSKQIIIRPFCQDLSIDNHWQLTYVAIMVATKINHKNNRDFKS